MKIPAMWTAVLLVVAGCGGSQQFAELPSNVDKDKVPHESIRMTAEQFKFTPDIIRVKAGTLVRLEITSKEGTHGFQLGAFGIDERIDENESKSFEFFASKQGEYGIRCSHFCGLGHMGMTGTLIVE